jgi:hypothetical protein
MMTAPSSLYISLVMAEREGDARRDHLAALARLARDCCRDNGSRLRRFLTRPHATAR